MLDMNKVAKNIKNARTKKNMTQLELADIVGVSYQAVSNWERGNSMPDIGKISDMLVKRPLLVTDKTVLAGFKEDAWKEALL